MALIALAEIVNESADRVLLQGHQVVEGARRAGIPLLVKDGQPAIDALHAPRLREALGLRELTAADLAIREAVAAAAKLRPVSLAERVAAVPLPIDTEAGAEALRVAHGLPAKLLYVVEEPTVEPEGKE